MNPYQFKDPQVRRAAFVLASAFEAFDRTATAALAALETSKGDRHEVAATPTLEPIGLASINAAPAHPTFMMRLEALRQVPLAKVPMQDVFANEPNYSPGAGGRLG